MQAKQPKRWAAVTCVFIYTCVCVCVLVQVCEWHLKECQKNKNVFIWKEGEYFNLPRLPDTLDGEQYEMGIDTYV